jgi:hypothetical protein
MAGLGLALIGGALKGFGEGQLTNIKATREEKLKQLELDRADRLEGQRQTFLASESEKNRASQEKLTQAQLAMNERLAQMQEAGATGRTVLTTQTQKELSKDQIAARRDEVAAQIASGEKIAGLETESRKDIAQMQIDAANQLDTKFVTQADGSSVMMQGGKAVKMPIDPATNKPMQPAITDNDTNEAKNVKYLLTLGVPQEKAMALVYNAKNANRDLAQAGIFKSIVDGMSTMKNLGESDFDFAQQKAKSITDSIYGPDETAAPAPAAPSSATEPTKPAEQQAKPLPPDMTKADMIAAAKAAVAAGKSKAAARQRLLEYDINPAEAGL